MNTYITTLQISLSKKMKDLYTENHLTPIQETEDNSDKNKSFTDQNIVKKSTLSEIQITFIKIPMAFSTAYFVCTAGD